MGTDIYGYIEAYDKGLGWRAVCTISSLAFRNYDMFGLLFGVRRSIEVPIAANRGFPTNASREASMAYQRVARFPGEISSASWLLWREVLAIDWEARARAFEAQGRLHPDWGKTLWKYLFEHLHALEVKAEKGPRRRGITAIHWKDVTSDMKRELAAQQKRGKFVDLPPPDWQTIFHLMNQLATKYGPQHVRLVVWFD